VQTVPVSDLTSLTVDELRDGYYIARIMPTDVVQAYLEAMARERSHGAYVLETPELARSLARGSRERVVRDESGRWLEGVPLAVDELLSWTPTAAIAEKLWHEGAICLGRIRACRGAAAAVAARLCAAAVGVDGGGSMLEAASVEGVVAVRPTPGRCSRRGIDVPANSPDQPGAVARSVMDAAILLRHMSGHDPSDPLSADIDTPDFEAAVGRSIDGVTVGLPDEYRRSAAADQVVAWLEGAGAEIVECGIPEAFGSGLRAILAPTAARKAGVPAIAVPVGLAGVGRPQGLQVIGRAYEEETLFSVARVIEEAAGRR
jgi:aspartyl-tRNA(Asn)/glutamyl-tRNA(Gln) amidotransferase subunit A